MHNSYSALQGFFTKALLSRAGWLTLQVIFLTDGRSSFGMSNKLTVVVLNSSYVLADAMTYTLST